MLTWEVLRSRVNEDPEFRLHSRQWTAFVRLGMGSSVFRMRLVDGCIDAVEPWRGFFASNLSIEAPQAEWEALLAPIPRPFYQDLYPASIHHGFNVTGDIESYCAYYPALRRLVELMRETYDAEV